jgi:alpha-L-rhamnosidase
MRIILSSFFSFFLFLISSAAGRGGMEENVSRLQCEHLVDPIGIDAKHPRLSWQSTDEGKRGARQTAYRLFLGTDSLGVAKGNQVQWSSGKVISSSNLVTVRGVSLKPFTRYYWRVELWGENGQSTGSSAIAVFETGMMNKENWQGSWISDGHDKETKPAPFFRHEFKTGKKIISARAYIAVAGLYELYINGQRIGDHRLDPMFTRFDRRLLYVIYDITHNLQQGNNAVGVLLGNGWFNHQSTAVWNFHLAPWRARPAFCMDIRITYADGSVETIASNKEWKTALSPVIFNSIYTAEHYDARLEQAGWNTNGFDDAKWRKVVMRSAPSSNIVAQCLQPIRQVEAIHARSFTQLDSLCWTYDLGRNISGVSRIKVKGQAGTVIRLKHGERLYKNGHVDLSNIDMHYRPTDDKDPFQTDIFILSGRGEEIFMPRFNYKGFQYVEVIASAPVELAQESLTGYFMHSDVKPIGSIRSSNTVINKIWEANNNSYLSNLFGYPTDCPQREKNGWTGDAHFANETGLYNFDAITIYEKWMADHRDEQQSNGVLPSIIPTNGWGYDWGNGPDWTSTIALIPWNVYLFTGDRTLLEDNFTAMERYVDHIDQLYPSGLTSWGLGDWVPVKSISPVELSSTSYYHIVVTILAKTSRLLGEDQKARKYFALAEKIKKAFNQKYYHTATGLYGSGLQTELCVPLTAGLAPDSIRAKVAANLASRIKADSFHLDAGVLGAKAILNALSENGYADIAYKVAAQETYPSWGWWIKNGATTLYENWNIDAKTDISLNHVMFGEIGAWLFKGPGGIKPDENNPGFRNILLQPYFVEGLDHFEAKHTAPVGTILSSWKRESNKIVWQITVPPNATATIRFPPKEVLFEGRQLDSNKPMNVNAGNYSFEIK